jgi:transposase
MKYHQLTEEEKIFILTNYSSKSLGKISEILKVNKDTIYKFYLKWCRDKSINNIKQPGRPRKFNSNKIKIIENFLKKNPKKTLREVVEILDLGCCTRTLSKYVHDLGFRNYLAARKPFISDINVEKRKEFAKKFKRWTFRDWQKILFSDESSIELNKTYRHRVWRKRGERFKEKMYKKTNAKFGMKYVKVWSCFSSRGVGKLVFVDEKWSGRTYLRILKKYLKSEGERLIGKDFLFMDDNDKVHRCNSVLNWKIRNNVKSFLWPSQSSYLNPIENLWFLLKKNLYLRKYRDINDMKNQIEVEWENLGKEILESLIQSMPRRIAALKKSEGRITKY